MKSTVPRSVEEEADLSEFLLVDTMVASREFQSVSETAESTVS